MPLASSSKRTSVAVEIAGGLQSISSEGSTVSLSSIICTQYVTVIAPGLPRRAEAVTTVTPFAVKVCHLLSPTPCVTTPEDNVQHLSMNIFIELNRPCACHRTNPAAASSMLVGSAVMTMSRSPTHPLSRVSHTVQPTSTRVIALLCTKVLNMDVVQSSSPLQ
jgi:hypothetical protein